MDNKKSAGSRSRPAKVKPPSLKDIAARAGVSYSLVSKVLRNCMGNAGVRKELRQKIMRIAAEMNYRPHSLASALKMGRKGAIGVLLHPFGERGTGLVEDLIKGISNGLDQRGLRMWLTFFEFDEQLTEHLDIRMRHDIDGLIVAGVPHPSTDALIKEMHASGLPVVTMMQETPLQGITNVAQDRYMQGYLPAHHLLSQRRHHIAYMIDSASLPFYHGIVDAHREMQVELFPELCYRSTNYKMEQGETAVEHWLNAKHKFDAVLTQSDLQAWGVIQALQRHGLRVPEDVMVTGVDNSVLANSCPITITSVTAEMETVGNRLVDSLSQLIENTEVASSRIPVQLIQRASA